MISCKKFLLLFGIFYANSLLAKSSNMTLFGSMVGSELAEDIYGGGLSYENRISRIFYLGGDLEYWKGTQTLRSSAGERELDMESIAIDFYLKHYLRHRYVPNMLKPYGAVGVGTQHFMTRKKEDLPGSDRVAGLGFCVGLAISVDYSSYFIDYRYRAFSDQSYDSVNIGLSSFLM